MAVILRKDGNFASTRASGLLEINGVILIRFTGWKGPKSSWRMEGQHVAHKYIKFDSSASRHALWATPRAQKQPVGRECAPRIWVQLNTESFDHESIHRQFSDVQVVSRLEGCVVRIFGTTFRSDEYKSWR